MVASKPAAVKEPKQNVPNALPTGQWNVENEKHLQREINSRFEIGLLITDSQFINQLGCKNVKN